MELEISRLTLIAPLFYVPEEALPFEYREGDGEKLFCFDLNKDEYMKFEPEREKLLGDLIFYGRALEFNEPRACNVWEFTRGNYMFAQKRKLLNREEILALAVEIQQETLWQQLIPEKKLCLRYLYEDGETVTQLFRPCKDD